MAVDLSIRHRLMTQKSYFLKGMLGIYVISFMSLYLQVRALFGDEGIVPVKDYLKKTSSSKANLEAFNIVQLATRLNLEYGTFLELVCLTATIVSAAGLLSKRFINAFSFSMLWYLYYSLHQIGQGFVSFRTDMLILEVGFLAIFLAPLVPRSRSSESDHDHLFWFLLRWVVFRWFVSSIVSMYLEEDPSVYNLTQTKLAAQSVPFPSPVNWHIYNLDSKYQAFIQPFQHTLKLLTPFLIVFDLKYCRLFAFHALLYLSLFQAIFDNEGFVDIIIALCLLSILKDSYFHKDSRVKQSSIKTVIDLIFLLGFLALVAQVIVKGFGGSYVNNTISFKAKFTPQVFKKHMPHFLAIVLAMGVYDFMKSTYRTYSLKKTSFIKKLIYNAIAIALFLATLPTISKFDQNLENRLLPLKTKELSRFSAQFKLVNSYQVPLKLSEIYADGRPELVIESKESASDKSWDSFSLQYKPSHTFKKLPLVTPHLPRLDLKMWYAARSTLTSNQWLVNLAYRLAVQNSDVSKLMASNNYISKTSQIRVALYKYKFSKPSAVSSEGYWSKPTFIKEYLPSSSIEDLKQIMKANGVSTSSQLTTRPKDNSIEKMLNNYLDVSSSYIRNVDSTGIIWTLLSVVCLSMLK